MVCTTLLFMVCIIISLSLWLEGLSQEEVLSRALHIGAAVPFHSGFEAPCAPLRFCCKKLPACDLRRRTSWRIPPVSSVIHVTCLKIRIGQSTTWKVESAASLFIFTPRPLFLQMHLHRSANRGLVQIWEFFRTSKSEICWQELRSALTRATPDHQAPFPDFFRNRNNKQTVKRFLIAIRNSKTVYHRPISHSRMQFMAYLVVFISFAILLGCLWITRQLQILHLHKSNSFRKRANLKA